MCVKICCCVKTLLSWDVGHNSCDDMSDMTHVWMCWYMGYEPRVDVCAISRVLKYKKWPMCGCFDVCGNYTTHVSIYETWPVCVYVCAISRVLIYNTGPKCIFLYVWHDSRWRIRWNHWKRALHVLNTHKSPQKSPEEDCKWVEQILKTGLSLAKDWTSPGMGWRTQRRVCIVRSRKRVTSAFTAPWPC